MFRLSSKCRQLSGILMY